MRRGAFLLAILVSAVHAACAGLVIVQEANQFGPMPGKVTLTMKISAENARVDVGDQLSSIVDLSTGKTISLLHAQKTAMQLPPGAIEALTEKTTARTARPDVKPTGKKDTISGYACEEYAGTFQGLAVSYWVTPDVPHQREVLAQMSRLATGSDPLKAAAASGADFPGFPIRTIAKSPQFGDMTMTVLSIKEAEIPAGEFQVPATYHTMAVPKMPANSSPSDGPRDN